MKRKCRVSEVSVVESEGVQKDSLTKGVTRGGWEHYVCIVTGSSKSDGVTYTQADQHRSCYQAIAAVLSRVAGEWRPQTLRWQRERREECVY